MKHVLFACPAWFQGTLATLITCLACNFSAKAQVLVPPDSPDIYLNTASNLNATINVDALQSPTAPGVLWVYAWDDLQGIGVEFANPIASLYFNIPQASMADVALSNDMGNLNDYIAGIVYYMGGRIFFDTYTISGAATGPLSYVLDYHILLSMPGSVGEDYPHIDMFADDTAGAGGGAASFMHRFVVSWTERDNAGNYHLKAAYGDMATPFAYNTVEIEHATGPLLGDVAASDNIATGHLNAYFAIENDAAQNLQLRQLDCTSGTLGPGTILSANQAFLPRIEAMGLDNPALSSNPWAVVSPLWNGVSYDIYAFDNALPSTGQNVSQSLFSGLDNRHVAIAAGVGPTYPEPCSLNYYFGWAVNNGGSNIFVARGIDYLTGSITDPDFYQVNTGAVSGIGERVPLALGSFSNSGKALITAWYSPPKGIFYKLTTAITDYKPAGIGEINKQQYLLYPNPARDKLNILNLESQCTFEIISLSGQKLLSGSITSSTPSIDIRSLSPGMYILNLFSDKGQQHLKFAKAP